MAKIDLNDYLEKLTEPEDRETVANRAYQRELFEQYVTKDGNFPEQRAQLLEDFRAGKELTGPKGLRRKLGAFDLEYFGRAYLAHYFVRPSPKFHGELDRIWREGVLKGMNPEVDAKRISRADGCRRAIEAPRGHAKSTTFTFKDDLHAAVYGYKHYIIILSDSSEQAEGFLVDIKTELEENAALKEDFGELEGKVWKSSVILLANGVKIEAIGSGKKIRGRRHKQWRPDLIVCDDLENDENVNTPEQRKKLRDWFYKAVSKAGDTYTDIVYIGTLLHFDALLANVAKNPSYKSVRYQGVISFATNGELWDAWESIFTDLSNDNRQEDALEFFQANREAMLEGTAVLWEEKLSYYDLMVIRISEGEASFNSEIQNDPIDPENCTFQEEWFDFWDDEGKAQPDFSDPKFLFVGANDPSLGKNKKSDTSSIIALAKDTQTGYLYVVIADIAKRKPDQIIEDALDASRRLQREYKRPYYKFGVETVQFQYYFAEIMRQRAAAVGEYLPKNLGFTYAYTIDDADGDTLTVVEELNDETIRTINNAPKGEELTVTITSEKLYALGLNSVNTLKITVTDGKGGTAYRRVTFKRTNSAPTISGQDKALGLKNGSFAENYTVSDVEGDNVVVTEFVDDVQIRSYQATLGQQETIELTREKWLSLTNGQHQLRIEAVDGNFATSVRVFSFSKKETVIKFELVAPEETDAAATKVLVTPTWKIEGAVAKVEACNNGFDAVPTWEDITAMVQINRVYNFTNKTKTASKWGVNIRFTITKNEGFEGEVSISGFGGAYE